MFILGTVPKPELAGVLVGHNLDDFTTEFVELGEVLGGYNLTVLITLDTLVQVVVLNPLGDPDKSHRQVAVDVPDDAVLEFPHILVTHKAADGPEILTEEVVGVGVFSCFHVFVCFLFLLVHRELAHAFPYTKIVPD